MKARSRTCKRVCLLRGSGGMLRFPRKILNLDPLTLLLTQSGTRLLFNTCDKTLLNFKIFWGGGGFQPPPYETLTLINKWSCPEVVSSIVQHTFSQSCYCVQSTVVKNGGSYVRSAYVGDTSGIYIYDPLLLTEALCYSTLNMGME